KLVTGVQTCALPISAVGWLVLAAGASSGRPHTGSLRWGIPPVLRLAEYASILWLGALAGGSGPAAAFALLAAVAFRHYDLIYRRSEERRVGKECRSR